MKFSPLILARDRCWSMRHMYFIAVWRVFFARKIDELEYEGSTCDDAAASREKISANDVFENG